MTVITNQYAVTDTIPASTLYITQKFANEVEKVSQVVLQTRL